MSWINKSGLYYVSKSGMSTNSGTWDQPFANLGSLSGLIPNGTDGTVYVGPGAYYLESPVLGVTSYTVPITADGIVHFINPSPGTGRFMIAGWLDGFILTGYKDIFIGNGGATILDNCVTINCGLTSDNYQTYNFGLNNNLCFGGVWNLKTKQIRNTTFLSGADVTVKGELYNVIFGEGTTARFITTDSTVLPYIQKSSHNLFHPGCNIYVDNQYYSDLSSAASVFPWLFAGCIQADPQFVKASLEGYVLAANSPALTNGRGRSNIGRFGKGIVQGFDSPEVSGGTITNVTFQADGSWEVISGTEGSVVTAPVDYSKTRYLPIVTPNQYPDFLNSVPDWDNVPSTPPNQLTYLMRWGLSQAECEAANYYVFRFNLPPKLKDSATHGTIGTGHPAFFDDPAGAYWPTCRWSQGAYTIRNDYTPA